MAKVRGDLDRYPTVQVEYRWKLCNYNEENTTIKFADAQNSYFKLWIDKEKHIIEKNFTSSTKDLDSGECVSLNETQVLDTRYSHHYMAAQLSSPPYVNGAHAEGTNCYAYAFNPFEVTYGQCNVKVCSMYYQISCNINILSTFAHVSYLISWITD